MSARPTPADLAESFEATVTRAGGTPAATFGHSTGGNPAPKGTTYRVFYEAEHQGTRKVDVEADQVVRGETYIEMFRGGLLVFVLPAHRLMTITVADGAAAS